MKKANSQFGFTLIELLVVISIIGILATLLIARYGMTEKSARDAERKSDLNQYRIALENFAVKSGGLYPSRTAQFGYQASDSPCKELKNADCIADCPEDPLFDPDESPPSTSYRYKTDGDGGGDEPPTATKYVLWATAETGLGYWVVCSNGKVGELDEWPSISEGKCPL